MTALEILTAKNKNTNISPEDLELALGEVEQSIKSYCNRDDVPLDLNYTWANMALELAEYLYEKNKPVEQDISSVDSADVASIKIGDTQINLGSGGNSNPRNRTLKSHAPNLDQIVLNYKDQLKRFRRMVW